MDSPVEMILLWRLPHGFTMAGQGATEEEQHGFGRRGVSPRARRSGMALAGARRAGIPMDASFYPIPGARHAADGDSDRRPRAGPCHRACGAPAIAAESGRG